MNDIGHKKISQHRGFTLIEIVLALSIGAIGVLLTAQSFLLIFTTRSYQEAMLSIGEESRYIFSTLSTEIREASDVPLPGPGDTGPSLILLQGSSTVAYALIDDVIWESRDGGLPSRITGAKVRVIALSFQHLYPGDTPLIRMMMTLSAGDDDTVVERVYEETLVTSITVRQ